MKRIDTELEGAFIIEPPVHGDSRGFFMETWNQERYTDVGVESPFVQDNLSSSEKGVLRGLHFQWQIPQGKLIYVLQGEIWDVAVDIRLGSKTFGEWTSVVLSEENRRQFYIDRGFAHGFLVTSEKALVAYKCTAPYRPDFERTLLWNDPDVAINWPAKNVKLSQKDTKGVPLRMFSQAELPMYLPPKKPEKQEPPTPGA